MGPFGKLFLSSIKAFRLAGFCFTNNCSESFIHIYGLPKFAFKGAFEIFFAVLLAKSKIHNSTELLVVLVNANFFSSGEKLMYAIFGSDGKPITCSSVLPVNLLVFKLLTYVIELEILVMGFTLNPANFISSWFKSSRDL